MEKNSIELFTNRIIKITIYDPTDRYGIRKGKLKTSIEIKSEKIWLRLKDYDESDDFLKVLSSYTTVAIEGSDDEPGLADEKEDIDSN